MDIPRKTRIWRKIVVRIIIGVILLVVVGAFSLYISKMEPATPSVDRATVWIDTVKQGSMSRAVRGMGKLVPEEIRWIPATIDGIVERKVLEPGAVVAPDTVIIELSNPQLERDTIDGTIVLEKLEEVVYMGLPVQAQANSQISLFRISSDGRTAERVKVRLGNTSVNTVEIQEWLTPGDQVILSDMSAHDNVDSIRLN